MPAPGPRRAAQPRLSLLVALLLTTIVLAALVAVEANEATISHRVTAERALRDYASVAAWEFAADAREGVARRVEGLLGAVTGSKATSPFEPPISPQVILAGASGLACGGSAEGDAIAFRVDLQDGTIALAGGGPAGAGSQLTDWLREAIATDVRTRLAPDARFAALRPPAASGRDLVVYGVRWAQHGAPLAAYGVATCLAALVVPELARTLRDHPLLPGSVTGGAPTDSLLAIRVSDERGRRIFSSARVEPSAYAGDARIPDLPHLNVTATLRPLAAERLMVGRPTSSRLPLFVGLLAVTSALAVIALIQLRRERELERLRADFTSSVSHELRTPLAQILLFGETLALDRARSGAERRLAAETIVQEARRLMHMVENLLHFSRARGPVADLTLDPTELGPQLEAIAGAFGPLADASGAHVITRIEPSVIARVDPGALRQIVLNLLDNAVKYGVAGQTVTLTLERRAGVARIAVADEGRGIPPEDRERVWSPYVRLRRDRNAAHGGSGIGLAVVRELTERLHGRTSVEDAEGGGACFVVELPLAEADGGPVRPPVPDLLSALTARTR